MRVSELLRQFFNIAFLMGRPQDLPPGRHVMYTGIGLAFITYVVALMALLGPGDALLHASVDLGFTALALYGGLLTIGREARFEQAFAAYCGASSFINLAALPIYVTRPPIGSEPASGVSALAEFVLLVWGLSLLAHVVRHTFELRLWVSVLVSVAYVVVLLTIMGSLFGAPQAPAPEVSRGPALVVPLVEVWRAPDLRSG